MVEILTLKNRKDFLRVAKGIKVVTTSIILQATLSLCETENIIRFGYTATKRIGKANIRNRAKRRMRAVVRDVAPELGNNQFEYVIIARFNTAEIEFDTLKRDISYAISKANKIITDGNKKCQK